MRRRYWDAMCDDDDDDDAIERQRDVIISVVVVVRCDCDFVFCGSLLFFFQVRLGLEKEKSCRKKLFVGCAVI